MLKPNTIYNAFIIITFPTFLNLHWSKDLLGNSKQYAHQRALSSCIAIPLEQLYALLKAQNVRDHNHKDSLPNSLYRSRGDTTEKLNVATVLFRFLNVPTISFWFETQ